MRCANGLAAAVMITALLPGAASGATVELKHIRTEDRQDTTGAHHDSRVYHLRYVAEPGETNGVSLSADPATGYHVFTINDAGGALAAGDNCELRPGGARCTIPPPWDLADEAWADIPTVDLGDGNDGFYTDMPASVNGGPGDDNLQIDSYGGSFEGGPGSDLMSASSGGSVTYASRTGPVSVTLDNVANDGEPGEGDDVRGMLRIVGGNGDDQLSAADKQPTELLRRHGDAVTIVGGPGNDAVTGGPDADHLDGGSGDDVLDGRDGDENFIPEPGADVYIGGNGSDSLFYQAQYPHTPIRVSLDGVADDGPAGEGDNVMPDVENVLGGGADDVLIGSDAANILGGGAGNDILKGMGGDDSLFGHLGTNELDGGAGTDRITSEGAFDGISIRDVALDALSCTGKSQLIIDADRAELQNLPTGCGVFPVMRGSTRIRMTADGVVRLTVNCPAMPAGGSCSKVGITDGGRTVTRRLRNPDGHGRQYLLRLPMRVRREVRQRGRERLTAFVMLRQLPEPAPEHRFSRRITVLPPRRR